MNPLPPSEITVKQAALPSARRRSFDAWLASQTFPSILKQPWSGVKTTWLDLRAEEGPFADPRNVADTDRFVAVIDAMLAAEQAMVGLGGYGEQRAFYNTDAYQDARQKGRRRNVHLGLDIWTAAGQRLFATIPGTVMSVYDNAGERNYGPTLILSHEMPGAQPFYTLYGHLDEEVLMRLKTGDQLEAGEWLGTIGSRPRNGNWPPHVHVQVMLDLLGQTHDFPGVGFGDELNYWLDICPDPAPLIGW